VAVVDVLSRCEALIAPQRSQHSPPGGAV
jgi:hypothetical protein